ncbi:uncharacterized protein LOC122572021 isoform X10 [Bombus pyrosoma]|uniref:uncharacterized protein LOC122572021 isoform X10 n=1 Tax=Bombus pyrosoma TaxID=396416 RepID=UPI001CB9B749|nr:uncharacterized protein LOC122572021 isoform X10 [Bombus pyrosoma]
MSLKFSVGNFYETYSERERERVKLTLFQLLKNDASSVEFSYSENETLQRGDVIKKIDDYDTRDVRHVDAQNLLQNSESIRLVVERSEPSNASRINITTSSPIIQLNTGDRAAVTSLAKQRKIPSELPKSPVPPPLIDEYRPPASSPEHLNLPHEHLDEVREERANLSQPYRTTPLVLPGAKIKKDAPLGECYLRHHPNPMIRAAPHHYEQAHPEVAMKQKVVHKQFNSPIGLYSEQNIADTIKSQTTAIPIFIDFSFVKQKQEIQEQARILKEQAIAAASKNVWPQFNRPN